MLANAIRAHFAEFGIITAQGTQNLGKLKQAAEDGSLSKTVMDVLNLLFDQLDGLNKRIKELELRIHAWHKNNKTSKWVFNVSDCFSTILWRNYPFYNSRNWPLPTLNIHRIYKFFWIYIGKSKHF